MNINFNLYWKLNWKLRFVNAKSIIVSRPRTPYPPALTFTFRCARGRYAACPAPAPAPTVTKGSAFFAYFFLFCPVFNACFVLRCVPNWIWAAFILMPFSVCLAHLICRTAQGRGSQGTERTQQEREGATHTHTYTHKTATFQKVEIVQIEFSDFLCSCSSCGLFLSKRPGPASTRPARILLPILPPAAPLLPPLPPLRHSPLSWLSACIRLEASTFSGQPPLSSGQPDVPLEVHFNGFSVEASFSPRL